METAAYNTSAVNQTSKNNMTMQAISAASNTPNQAATGALQHPRWLHRRSQSAFVAPALACLLGVASVFGAATTSALPGDIGDKYRVNDDNPIASIPSTEEKNQNPIEFAHFLQDLIARSESAFRKQDWEKSVKYYEAVAVAVPDRALPFSRLCTGYSKLGKLETAITKCALAITLPGAKVMDHLRFVNLTLQKPALTAIDVSNVEHSLQHLRDHIAKNPQPPPAWDKAAVSKWEAQAKAQRAANRTQDPDEARERLLKNSLALQFQRQKQALSGDKSPDETDEAARPEVTVHVPTEIEVLTCKLAVHTNDGARLAECMAALRGYKVDERLMFPFSWSKALIEKDAQAAAALLAQAPQFGVSDATLESMTHEHEKVFLKARIVGLLKRWGLPFVLMVLCLSGAAFASKRWRRSRRPQTNDAATSQA